MRWIWGSADHSRALKSDGGGHARQGDPTCQGFDAGADRARAPESPERRIRGLSPVGIVAKRGDRRHLQTIREVLSHSAYAPVGAEEAA